MSDSKAREEILSASFWENWKYYKELCAIKSSKRFKQRESTENIRKEWIEEQKKNKK